MYVGDASKILNSVPKYCVRETSKHSPFAVYDVKYWAISVEEIQQHGIITFPIQKVAPYLVVAAVSVENIHTFVLNRY